MKLSNKLIISLFVIVMMSTGAAAQGQAPEGQMTIDNDNLAVEITGGENVPKFSFWEPGANSSVYRVQFVSMFEVVDNNTNGAYDDDGTDKMVPDSNQALSAWSWDFTDVETGEDETSFNITSDGTAAPALGNSQVTFVNHLGSNASEFKFDVVVDNYNFTSDNDNAMLVLGFMLTSQGNSGADQTGNSVDFGNAYMDVEETASTDDGNIGVDLSTPKNGSSMAYLSYENFNGGFVHDPTLGINASPGDEESLPLGISSVIIGFLAMAPIFAKIRKD